MGMNHPKPTRRVNATAPVRGRQPRLGSGDAHEEVTFTDGRVIARGKHHTRAGTLPQSPVPSPRDRHGRVGCASAVWRLETDP